VEKIIFLYSFLNYYLIEKAAFKLTGELMIIVWSWEERQAIVIISSCQPTGSLKKET